MKVPEWTRSLRVAEGARKNRKLGRNPRTMRLTGELSLLHYRKSGIVALGGCYAASFSMPRFFDRADPLERVADFLR